MIILIITLVIGSAWLLLSLISDKQEDTTEVSSSLPDDEAVPRSGNPFFPPKAPVSAEAYFTVIDIQTNGLISDTGLIPDPIQISWLNLSEDFLVISHKTLLIRQEYLGNLSAKRVHNVSSLQLEEHGKSEFDASEAILEILNIPTILVFHNAEFDVQILHRMLSRHYPEKELSKLHSKKTVCTMRFEEHLYDQEYRYAKLTHRTSQLTGIPISTLSDHPVTSWRNVCLTRLCLKQLCETHRLTLPLPAHLLVDFGSYYQKTAPKKDV